jgi:hypothetical protein
MTAAPATMAELTFALREAPSRSRWAGQLMAEVRATSPEIKLLKAMLGLGLWHPTDECAINVMETYRHPVKLYKILRFTASPEVYRQLHELCSPPTEEDIARLTDSHIARLSVPTAIEALVSDHSKDTLKAMAAVVNPNYSSIIGKNPNKRKLAELICSQAA